MRIKSLFAASCFAIFAGMLFSCSNDDEMNNVNSQEKETRYMSVTISYRGSGARAETFEDGTKESTLSNASIFFFDAAGATSDVCLNGATGENSRLTNRFDIPYETLNSATQTGTTNDNITASTPVKIIISTEAGEKIPTRVVAVCNYPNMSNLAGLNYAELKKELLSDNVSNSAATTNTVINEGKFVMSNAVYAENTTEMFSTPVTAENICKTEALAKAHSVHIYVERVNAKVQADISASIRESGDPTYEYKGNQYPIYKINDESDLFLAVLGWNVTAVAPCTSLGKDINEAWPSDLFSASEPWNSLDYKRSYWAINPKTIVLPEEAPYNGSITKADKQMQLQHGTFEDAYKRGFTSNTIAYIYENAATYASTSNGEHKGLPFVGSKVYNGYTQVIVPGILLKKDGANYVAADICKWLGTEYTKADLKTAWANQVATELFYYDDGTHSYKSIRPEDLDFITIDDLQKAHPGVSLVNYGIPADTYRRYSAWACLSNGAESIQWYDKSIGSASTDAEKKAAKMTPAKVNKYLKELLPAQVYKDGLTYYYFDINHLGGKKGVVRNHVYKFTINQIKGHGTPVYDPTEVIIPEKTEDVASYIAATIDILAWRIINQSVTLGD